MNYETLEERNNNLILKIEDALDWINETIDCLNEQIYFSVEKIKYYDWEWNCPNQNTKNSVFRSFRNIDHPKYAK